MPGIEITNVWIAALIVVAGLAILLYAGNLLVCGAVAVAKQLRIAPIVIGLTIVAFGTSAPELFIGVQSVFTGHADLAFGNVIGSNIANVLLVLGVPSIIYPTICKQHSIRRNTLFMIGATLLLIWMMWDGRLAFAEGVALVMLIAFYLGYWFNKATRSTSHDPFANELSDIDSIAGLPKTSVSTTLYLIGGLIGLPFGASLIVDGGVFIAEDLGVDESLIGLSLIAIGTSLPELATTVIAAMRRHSAVAIGNVIGSNLFNILAVMGVTVTAAGERGLRVPPHLMTFDIWIMLATSALLLPFAFFHKSITRPVGIVFVVAYGLYLFYIFNSGHYAAASYGYSG